MAAKINHSIDEFSQTLHILKIKSAQIILKVTKEKHYFLNKTPSDNEQKKTQGNCRVIKEEIPQTGALIGDSIVSVCPS